MMRKQDIKRYKVPLDWQACDGMAAWFNVAQWAGEYERGPSKVSCIMRWHETVTIVLVQPVELCWRLWSTAFTRTRSGGVK